MPEAGPRRLFPEVVQDGRVRIICYFAEHKSPEELAELEQRIKALSDFGLNPGQIKLTTVSVEEEEWATAWKDYYHTTHIGKVVIQPSWQEPETDIQPDDVVIVLDPGMAFGTGTHPTTVMCLEFLQELDLQGKILWDVGTGSGILSIAACKLCPGACSHVDGLPLVAQDNRDMNEVDFTVVHGSIEALPGN